MIKNRKKLGLANLILAFCLVFIAGIGIGLKASIWLILIDFILVGIDLLVAFIYLKITIKDQKDIT